MLQALLFPGNDDDLKVAFLKPNGVSPKFLAYIRLGCMIWMILQTTVRNFFFSNSDLLYTFTNWSMTSNALSYLVLVCAHLMNGDFFKNEYEEVDPSQIDDRRRPYYLWTAAQGFYEFAFTVSLTVTLAYGAVEYSFMRTTGFFIGVHWFLDLLGWGIHVVP